MEQARTSARLALAEGDTGIQFDAETVAILEFKNEAGKEYVPFVKGLTAMVITDLSKVPQLKVVERARMQALLTEMQLSQTGLVDSSTGAKVGRLLQAQTIDWGSLQVPDDNMIRINSVLSDTFSRSTVGESSVEGLKTRFFELEKQIVFAILADLGINKEDLDESVLEALQEIETTSFDAFMHFGAGLEYLDNGNYSEAKDEFEMAADLDPEFEMAATAEEETPAVAIDASSYELDLDLVDAEGDGLDGTTSESEDTVASSSGAEEATTEGEVADEGVEGDWASDFTETDSADNYTVDADVVDATTEVVQDTTAIETGGGHTSGGPTQRLGYFTNILNNGEGLYHGTFYIESLQDLNNWSASSTWFENSMEGEFNVINSLVVVDPADPITGGMPNETTWTPIGSSSYMTWGHWSDTDEMVRQSNPTPPLGRYLFDATGYYIYGDVTTEQQIMDLAASDRSFSYTGDAWGTHAAEPGVMMTGGFNASVDILGGFVEIPNFDLSISSTNHSAEIVGASGFLNDFGFDTFFISGGTWSVDGLDLNTSDLYSGVGSFYGPNAEEMGGTFVIEKDSGDNAVVGMFKGGKP